MAKKRQQNHSRHKHKRGRQGQQHVLQFGQAAPAGTSASYVRQSGSMPEPKPRRWDDIEHLAWRFWNEPAGSEFRLRFVADPDESNPAFWLVRRAIACSFKGGINVEIPPGGKDAVRDIPKIRRNRRYGWLKGMRPRPLYVMQGFLRPDPGLKLFVFRDLGRLIVDSCRASGSLKAPAREFVLRMGEGGLPDYARCGFAHHDSDVPDALSDAEAAEARQSASELRDFDMPDINKCFTYDEYQALGTIYRIAAKKRNWSTVVHKHASNGNGLPVRPTGIPLTGM